MMATSGNVVVAGIDVVWGSDSLDVSKQRSVGNTLREKIDTRKFIHLFE
jgi:hypothetical protein